MRFYKRVRKSAASYFARCNGHPFGRLDRLGASDSSSHPCLRGGKLESVKNKHCVNELTGKGRSASSWRWWWRYPLQYAAREVQHIFIQQRACVLPSPHCCCLGETSKSPESKSAASWLQKRAVFEGNTNRVREPGGKKETEITAQTVGRCVGSFPFLHHHQQHQQQQQHRRRLR